MPPSPAGSWRPTAAARSSGASSELLIAEATAPESLVGKPLLGSGIRNDTGLTVGGIWDRGELLVARPSTVLTETSILVLAGSEDQLARYDDRFASDDVADRSGDRPS